MRGRLAKWTDTFVLIVALSPVPYLAGLQFGMGPWLLSLLVVGLAWAGMATPDRWLVYAMATYGFCINAAYCYSINFSQAQALGMLYGAFAAPLALSCLVTARGAHRKWVMTLVLIGSMIAFYSGPIGGAGRMFALLTEQFGLLPEDATQVVFVIRKTVHVICYGTLGVVGLFSAYTSGRTRLQSIAFGVAVALGHAVFDESRQTLFRERSGSAIDVLLDAAGMVAFLIFGSAWITRREKRAQPSDKVS